MENTETIVKKSYFVNTRERKGTLYILAVIFSFTYFLCPQYFGFQIAGFDITVNRFFLILFYLIIFLNPVYAKEFTHMVFKQPKFIPIACIVFVLAYTMIFRADINTLMNGLIEFLFLFLFLYIFQKILNADMFIKIVRICSYILCIEGIYEYITTDDLFWHLQTIPFNLNAYIRSGSYRIMGPCGHALGYGLLLELLLPICCYNIKKKSIDLIGNLPIVLLLLINIFFTGSRSSQGFFFAELFILFLLLNKQDKRDATLVFIIGLTIFAIFIIAFHNTSIGRYFLTQFAGIIDAVLGTSFSNYYGAETIRLQQSESYRKALPKVFKISALNPLLGRGVSKGFSYSIDGISIISIDNFYIASYIRYAYPGMLTYIFFIIYTFADMIKDMLQKNKDMTKSILIALIIYFSNLYFVDSLQTLRYAYVFIALFYSYYINSNNGKEIVETKVQQIQSKYIKRRL